MAGLEEDPLTLIKNLLAAVGYPGVFLLMAIEGFGIPIPSELTMPFSGFLASSAGGSKFVLPVVVAVGAAGEIVGGLVAYFLGYRGGRPMLVRYGHMVFIKEAELERGERWFARYGDWVVLVTRLLPAVRGFIALPAGVVRMPFWRFLSYSALGSAVWCTVLAIIGHSLGQNWQAISTQARKFNVVVVIVIFALVAFAVYRRLSRGDADRDEEDSKPLAASDS